MNKQKISITLTAGEWRKIIYILGALAGYTDYADAIEKQMLNKKNKEDK